MSDLKTLKDFERLAWKGASRTNLITGKNIIVDKNHNPELIEFIDVQIKISYQELRNEAIKHYKKEVGCEIHTEPKTAFEWIEEFFDLTKEDLHE